MPMVTPPAKVLVTGANGFIAVWIVRYLLEQGYSVRGTVRTDSKAKYLKERFAQYGDKLELSIIPDMEQPNAFDDAVKGVQGILHTAAPVRYGGDYETIVKPSVSMTENILSSAYKHGAEVRRVVITSSTVALLEPHDPGYVYSDKDWNDHAVEELKSNFENAADYTPYYASKTLAERAAWKFYDAHKAEVKWDMATILFPYVFGPPIHQEYTNGKPQSFLYDSLQEEKPADTLGDSVGAWVDVRDVALAHVRALQEEEAADIRLILSAGPFSWQDVYDALATVQPPIESVPKGQPAITRKPPHWLFDTSKAESVLGITYRSLAESARDTILSIKFPGSF